MVNNTLTWYLQTKGCFNDFQSGFRKNRSTMDNLTFIETQIAKALKESNNCIIISFDLEKAYDQLWRKLIIDELLRVGLKGEMMTFIFNYLSEKHFHVITR